MNTVPLDLQRRCEQRWAARYRRPLEPAATQERGLQKQDQQQQASPTQARARQKPAEFSRWFEVVAPAA